MLFQIYSSVLSINSHIVRVNALQRVVIITVHAVIVPLWFIFFAITKQLPVVALPSITRIAISFSLLNPSFTAIGKNITQKRISFIKAIPKAVFILLFASPTLKDAPRAINERGVAIFPR